MIGGKGDFYCIINIGIMIETMKTTQLYTMKKYYFISLFILGLGSAATAQHHIGFYLNGASPYNQLKDSGYRHGIGFSFEYLSPSLFAPKTRSPFEVRIGAGIEFFHHGSSKKVENLVFNTPNNDLGSSKLQNQLFGFYVAPKFIFNIGRVSPYVDVFANARIFNSYQVNRFNREVQGYERTTSKPVVQNTAAHYGGSLGIIYNLGSRFAFDARVSYSTGSAINFVDLNSPTRDPDMASGIVYRKINTPVSDMLTYRIGVLIKIDCTHTSRPHNQTPRHENRIDYTPSTPTPKPAEVKPMPKPTPPVNH